MSAEIPAGAMRFNSDSQKLEYWNGSAWFQVHTATPNLANVGGTLTVAPNASDSTPGARGIFQGGETPTRLNVIEYINISSTGNAIDFGSRTLKVQYSNSVSSSTRGVTGGGDATTDTIDFITIASTGDATDFGNLFTGRYGTGAASSATRGVWAGGFTSPKVDTMDYVTIASTGDAKDFGNLTEVKGYLFNGIASSPTRGLFAGGNNPTLQNRIEFITISTTGNGTDFGDLTVDNDGKKHGIASFSNGHGGL